MENKELKKNAPVELDEELLDAVSGGSESSCERTPIDESDILEKNNTCTASDGLMSGSMLR